MDVALYFPLVSSAGSLLLLRGAPLRLPKFLAPLGLLFLYSLILWAVYGFPYLSRISLAVWLPSILLLAVGSTLLNFRAWYTLFLLYCLLVLLTGFWGYWHYGQGDYTLWGEPAKYGCLRVGGLIYYPNTFGTMALTLSMGLLALSRIFRFRETRAVYLLFFLIGLFWASLILTGSRGVGVSFFAGFVVACGFACFDLFEGWRGRRPWRRCIHWPAAFLSACAMVALLFFHFQALSQSYLSQNPGSIYSYADPGKRFGLGTGEYESGISWRLGFQRDNLLEAAKSPARLVFGGGANSFLPLSEATFGPSQVLLSSFAHSDYLDWFVDYGLLGGILGLSVLVLFLLPFFRPVFRSRLVWFAPLLVVWAVRAMVESDLHTTSGTLTVCLVSGLLYSLFFPRGLGFFKLPGLPSKGLWAGTLSLFFLGAYFLYTQAGVRLVVSRHVLDYSVPWAPSAKPADFEASANYLLSTDPYYPGNFRVAVDMASQYFMATHPDAQTAVATRNLALPQALGLSAALYDRNPYDMPAGSLLAFLLAQMGQKEGSDMIISELEAKFPDHLTLLWIRAIIASYEGKHDLAKGYLAPYLERTSQQQGFPLVLRRYNLAQDYLEGRAPVLGYWP